MTSHSPLVLSHLKLRHLKLIELLIQEGTMRKVAKQLNVSQPATTAMLNDLEEFIGLRLFARNRQGALPTDQAMAIAPRIQIILNEFDELASAIRRTAAGGDTVLRLGVVPQAFIHYLPKAIDLFLQQAGSCPIKTREATSRELLGLLMEGELDCVVGRLPSEGPSLKAAAASLNFVDLYKDEVCVVAGPGNPAAAMDKVSYQFLAQCNWVMQQPDSRIRLALTEAFLRKGIFLPEPVIETSSYVQNLSIVANSGLFTVAPRSAAQAYEALGLVKIMKIRLEVSPMQVCLITRKSSAGHQQLACFKKAFLQSLALADAPRPAAVQPRTRKTGAARRPKKSAARSAAAAQASRD